MSDIADVNETDSHEIESTETEVSEKRLKFKELAGKRVTNVLEAVRILGNLSNTASYEYSQADVDTIFGHIQAELDETKEKFLPKKPKEKKAFSL